VVEHKKEVVGKEVQLEGVSLRVLGKQRWSRDMLGRCKASLQRDAKMRPLGLTLRDEPGKVYLVGGT